MTFVKWARSLVDVTGSSFISVGTHRDRIAVTVKPTRGFSQKTLLETGFVEAIQNGNFSATSARLLWATPFGKYEVSGSPEGLAYDPPSVVPGVFDSLMSIVFKDLSGDVDYLHYSGIEHVYLNGSVQRPQVILSMGVMGIGPVDVIYNDDSPYMAMLCGGVLYQTKTHCPVLFCTKADVSGQNPLRVLQMMSAQFVKAALKIDQDLVLDRDIDDQNEAARLHKFLKDRMSNNNHRGFTQSNGRELIALGYGISSVFNTVDLGKGYIDKAVRLVREPVALEGYSRLTYLALPEFQRNRLTPEIFTPAWAPRVTPVVEPMGDAPELSKDGSLLIRYVSSITAGEFNLPWLISDTPGARVIMNEREIISQRPFILLAKRGRKVRHIAHELATHDAIGLFAAHLMIMSNLGESQDVDKAIKRGTPLVTEGVYSGNGHYAKREVDPILVAACLVNENSENMTGPQKGIATKLLSAARQVSMAKVKALTDLEQAVHVEARTGIRQAVTAIQEQREKLLKRWERP